MKQSLHFLMFAACLIMLTSCGMYVGNPPKTEVNETTTTTTPETTAPNQQPDQVHVYGN
jgi:flagellar basal body L-ring protein FlgH